MPFTLTVQARSGLRMAVAVTQDSRRPGSPAAVTATLTQAGIPLAHMAVAHAMVTDPSGAVSTIQLGEVADGVFRGAVATPVPGVYRILVRAEGATLHGVRFSREELRTVGVWSRGDEQWLPGTGNQPTGPDWCGLLTCLLDDAVLGRIAAQRGIDVDRLRDCVKRHCR